jgi:hypothetical protein
MAWEMALRRCRPTATNSALSAIAKFNTASAGSPSRRSTCTVMFGREEVMAVRRPSSAAVTPRA